MHAMHAGMRRAVVRPLGEGKLQAGRSESLVRARAASIGATDRAGLPSSLLPVMTRSVEATATATAVATGSSLIPLQQSAVSLQAMHS